jgi:ATP-dependent protease ClpP protease subunit
MKTKFYEFKNMTSSSADLYIYGEIVLEEKIDWFSGEKDKTAVDLITFKDELDRLEGYVNTLNLFINSPGGDVFVASTMVSMLERLKNTGITINAYVDGISASAASYLMMVANNIYLYKNSVVMIHKPMSYAYGNADDMQKAIDMLNKVEESVLLPLYLDKAKIELEEIKDLLAAETWFSAKDMQDKFDVTVLTSTNPVSANINKTIMNKYKNVPDFVKNMSNKNQNKSEKISVTEKNLEIRNEKMKKEKIKTKLHLVSNFIKMKEREENEIKSNC